MQIMKFLMRGLFNRAHSSQQWLPINSFAKTKINAFHPLQSIYFVGFVFFSNSKPKT